MLLRWSISAEIVPIGPLEAWPLEGWLLDSNALWGLLVALVGWFEGICSTFVDVGGRTGGGGLEGWVVFGAGISVGGVRLFKAMGESSVVLEKRPMRF